MTIRRLRVIALLVLLGCGTVTVRASSPTIFRGAITGFEICEQAVCGYATFLAVFRGRVDNNPFALGTMAIFVRHEPLPPNPGDIRDLTGGFWSLQLLTGRKLGGLVTGGEILNIGSDKFQVSGDLLITNGGTGTASFIGELSHQTLIPTINFLVYQ